MLAQRHSRPMSIESQSIAPEPDELQIIRLARSDLSAFAPLYERYFPRIYAYCLRRVENRQDAEDLTSSIFMQAVANLHGFRGESFAAWLFQIAHNMVINQLRRQPAHFPLEEDESTIPAKTPEPIDRIIADEEHQLLKKLVATLTDEQRDLLALKMAGELTSNEIGTVLGKNPGAVRVELHRIIKQLREWYWQEEQA